MAVSNKKKKAVLREYPGKSTKELGQAHNLSEREVRSVLREAGKLPPPSLKLPLIIIASVLAALGISAAAYFLITRPGPGKLAALRSKLNVLIVTIDTCRADHIGCYGRQKAQTPVIDSLAASGVRFDSAYALQPITLPSHATIFTGAHPAYHGIADNGLFKLPGQTSTLAEILKERGFTTGAVIASYVLHGKFGLGQGFDFYDDRLLGRSRQDSAGFEEIQAASISDVAVAWIMQNAGRQWFLWLHYYDPHADYLPPPEFKGIVPSPYDGEIAYVDSELKRVMDALDQNDLRDRTLVIVTSDHGESLGEHGELTHGLFGYEATLRVPLMLFAPRILAPRVVTASARHVDLLPTILDVLELPVLEELPGQSLLPLAAGQPPAEPVVTYFEAFSG